MLSSKQPTSYSSPQTEYQTLSNWLALVRSSSRKALCYLPNSQLRIPALRQNIKLCPSDWLLFGLPAIRQCNNSLPTKFWLKFKIKAIWDPVLWSNTCEDSLIHGLLPSKERLHHLTPATSPLCWCNSGEPESYRHLFFQCSKNRTAGQVSTSQSLEMLRWKHFWGKLSETWTLSSWPFPTTLSS